MGFPWVKNYDSGVNTSINLDQYESLTHILEASCANFASNKAMTCLGETMHYSEWNAHASDLAGFLQNEAGLKAGDRLAIMLPNLFQFPISFFAALKIGAVTVNTNPLYTAREMEHQFKDSGCKAIVIADLFLDKLEQILSKTQIRSIVVCRLGDHLPIVKKTLLGAILKLKKAVPKHSLQFTSYKEALKLGKAYPYRAVPIQKEDLCILQYTGGTTGVSKGAMLTHKNIIANMEQINEWSKSYLEDGKETVLTALPLYHIFALTVNFLALQAKGHHSILVPKPIPIKNTVKILRQHKISVMTGVNTLFNALNNDEGFRNLGKQEQLKIVLGGGMAVQSAVSNEFEKITGVPITEGYGLTEASPVTHVNLFGGKNVEGSIGLPVPSTEAKIVDEKGNEVPIGEEGELVVRGPQIMRGYWQRPEETEKSIQDGWLHTGDIAKQDERGYFFIVDRKKDMVLVSGFNVFPNEVESVLVEHPKVLEAAVIGVPDDKSGESVKAFIVSKDPGLTDEELHDYCKDKLTNYKRPRFYEFTKELPKTNVGKILRRQLREKSPKKKTA